MKEYLSQKSVEFEEVNVSGDKEAQQRLLSLRKNSTPVTVIGDKVISGYEPEDIDAALAEAGIG